MRYPSKQPVTIVTAVYVLFNISANYKRIFLAVTTVTKPWTPKNSLGPRVVSSDRTLDRVFHKPSCGKAAMIRREDEVFHSNAEDARKRGYVPCKFCRPG